MQRIAFHAKVVGSLLATSFMPVMAVYRAVLFFPFWPFSSQQTFTLAFLAGTLLTWFLLEKIYEDTSVTLTFSYLQKIRVFMSSPVRKPYVIIQSLDGNRWVSQGRCDLTALPLSPEDQEKLASFLEYIPDQDNRRQQVLEYILNQYSHEALTQFYQSLLGRTHITVEKDGP